MATDPVIADGHIHLFANGFVGPDGNSPAGEDEVSEYEKIREQTAIDAALVVGYEGELPYDGNNAYIGQMAQHHSWIKPLAYLDHSASRSDVQKWLDEGFYGVSIYAVEERDAESLSDLIEQVGPVLAERRAVVSLNAAPAVYPALRAALEALPVSALVSHFGLPAKGANSEREAYQALQSLGAMQENPNIAVKVSGFYAFDGLIDADEALSIVIEHFGVGRVVWGSDYPVALSSESFDQTIGHLSALSENDRNAILGDSLRTILARVELA